MSSGTMNSKPIDVVWHAMKNGRGYFNCTWILNQLFDGHDCVHHGGAEKFPDVEGAVVVVHGGRQMGSIDRLNMDIDKLQWCLLIFCGDEESTFPIEKVEHERKIVWIQEPLPGRPGHDAADRYLLDGYPKHCTDFLQKHLASILHGERVYDWVFAGQMTHRRRWECRNALQNIDWGGVIVESKGYTQGISLEEYYRLMCSAKIVPCPSGPFSPDAARPWEALESRCIPLLDDLSPSRPNPGFWKYVLGDHPLPTITDWSTVHDEIEEIKADWENITHKCQQWWVRYKADFFLNWLDEDLKKLRG